MKKIINIAISIFILFNISACTPNSSKIAQQPSLQSGGDVDLNLTELSSTMVYSEVYSMMESPEEFIGKTVKMHGTFSVWQDADTGRNYYSCIIADATACCSQGIEFEWKGEHIFPDDYPEENDEITVTGVFEIYEEDGYKYCHLKDAELIF